MSRPRHKKTKYDVNFKIFSHRTNSYKSLELKSYVKYLGVLTYDNLSWKNHMLRLELLLDLDISLHLIHIYKSLIQSYLLYSIKAWGRPGKTHRDKILRIQKRGLRLMSFCNLVPRAFSRRKWHCPVDSSF